MQNTKKLLALLLALAMLLAMTACGSEPKGSVSPSDSAAPEATPEPEDEIELGTMNGGTYENSFVGIGCKLDENWTYLSDEDILEMNEWVDDEDLAKRLRESDFFYDMVAMSEEGLTTVNVVIENLGLLYGTVLDTGSYIDAALKSLEDDLAKMGVDVTAYEKVSFDFCGKATDGIYLTGTMTVEDIEVEMYQRLACVKSGTYMCAVTACTYFEDTTTDVLDLFYAVK